MENRRLSGVLMPISSLPGDFGIGTLGKSAYRFIDWLKNSGFSLWQILPINPTSFGNSPYMSPSSFAGNPYLIDPEDLKNKGFLKPGDIDTSIFKSKNRVDYELIYKERQLMFETVFRNFSKNIPPEFYEFCRRNADWLQHHSVFSAIKASLGGAPLKDFPEELRLRNSAALDSFKKDYQKEIQKEKMLQFLFFEQWIALKDYANKNGIKIIGDMPIYVSYDSCEVWANPENFLLNPDLSQPLLAGCPPDSFSPLGQLWGNPLYDWEHLKSGRYRFLIKRVYHNLKLFDILRIDHFRGFESYYSVKSGEKTAINGEWRKGGGKDFISALNETVDNKRIIAEDLGFSSAEVEELLDFSGYPGMKVLQFIFDEGEESPFLPHFYSRNSVAYTGTHDNDTLLGRINSATENELGFILDYFKTDKKHLKDSLIIETLKSVCRYAIIPIQDILGLDSSGRMNTPGSCENNWEWRLESLESLSEYTNFYLKNNKLYGRTGTK